MSDMGSSTNVSVSTRVSPSWIAPTSAHSKPAHCRFCRGSPSATPRLSACGSSSRWSIASSRAPGLFLALVKPQFEVGQGRVGKGGVVRDDTLRKEALDAVIERATELGFHPRGAIESPLAGPAGNREWLCSWLADVRRVASGSRLHSARARSFRAGIMAVSDLHPTSGSSGFPRHHHLVYHRECSEGPVVVRATKPSTQMTCVGSALSSDSLRPTHTTWASGSTSDPQAPSRTLLAFRASQPNLHRRPPGDSAGLVRPRDVLRELEEPVTGKELGFANVALDIPNGAYIERVDYLVRFTFLETDPPTHHDRKGLLLGDEPRRARGHPAMQDRSQR
jgi:hypothetical protein